MGVAASTRTAVHSTTERVRALPFPLATFLWSRTVVWLTAIYAWVWFIPRAPKPPDATDLGYATEIWVRADAGWFLSIARHGYQRNGGAVFYPLYPLLVGGLGRVFGGYYVTAGIVVSLACCAGAFVLLYKLALPQIGADGACRAVVYLALFPMSLFLQAVYSESLYLLCCLGAFVLAERRRWVGAGVATGLALLTRVAGVALIPPLLIFAWRSPKRRRAVLESMIPGALLAVLYPLWLELKFHAFFAAFGNEAGWGRHVSHAGPFGGLWRSIKAAAIGVERIAAGDSRMQAAAHNVEYFAFLVLFVWLGVEAWRRFGAPYGLFVLGSLAIPLSVPTVGYPLLSMPRFCLPLFPAFLALAAIGTTARRDRAIVAASALFLGVAVVEWSVGQWVS
ncbi:MAG TPA: glycosyltransferase family 39 protein [Gaiellaceae bacterium]